MLNSMQNLAAIARLRAPSGDVPFADFGNTSRLFDGVNDVIRVTDNANFPLGSQTWCAWVYAIDLSGGRDVMAQWAATGLQKKVVMYAQATGAIGFYLTQNGNTTKSAVSATGTIVATGQWQHVVGRFTSSTEIAMFVDGSSVATETNGVYSSLFDSSVDFTIGLRDDPGTQLWWGGKIADVRIYDRALTDGEILDLATGTDVASGLFGHYIKDADFIANVAIDYGSGGNNGTNSGSTFDAGGPGD